MGLGLTVLLAGCYNADDRFAYDSPYGGSYASYEGVTLHTQIVHGEVLFFHLQDETYEIRDRDGNLVAYAFLMAGGFYHITDLAGNYLFQIRHNYEASYDIYGPRGYFYNAIYCPFPGHSHYNSYYYNVGLPLYYGHIDFGRRYYRVDRHDNHRREDRHRRGDNRGRDQERGGRAESDAGSGGTRSGDFIIDTTSPEPRFRDGSVDQTDRNMVTDRDSEVTSGNDRGRDRADRRRDSGREREHQDINPPVEPSPTIRENGRGRRDHVDSGGERRRDNREISPDTRGDGREQVEPRQRRPDNRRDNQGAGRDTRTDNSSTGSRRERRRDVDSGRGRQRENREISPDSRADSGNEEGGRPRPRRRDNNN